jgi:hypothetical protein
VNELIERLQKARVLTEPLYIELENNDEHIYYVSDAIGDALTHLYRVKDLAEKMLEWNI